MKNHLVTLVLLLTVYSCKKKDVVDTPAAEDFVVSSVTINNKPVGDYYITGVGRNPEIRIAFTAPIDHASANAAISFVNSSGEAVSFNLTFENSDSTIVIQPSSPLNYLSRYGVFASTDLKSVSKGSLDARLNIQLLTAIDPANKFPIVSDNQLLDIVQRQTFKYFWEFGHPVSGLARERNTSGDLVTSGGSGFGIMAIVAAVNRNFITRAEGLARMQTITSFLKNKAQKFHGAFPHWLNGANGQVIAFSTKDNGADLVETSFLMQGLLTARQYFNGASPAETALRNNINALYNGVEWDWFRKNNEDVLYWHWSPTFNWDINHQVKGWNECLITYVLAASSPTHSISKVVYDNGWASNGGMRNGNTYYGVGLPLGPAAGGPLFFAHYSFLGIDPMGLADAYARYDTQNIAHTLINYNYCKANPQQWYGYSDSCWGLTASDDFKFGYKVHEPNSDNGVISPTAALSSFPYAPAQSMKALKFFYYKLGDKIFKEYGFVDAFSLNEPWFANSFLAIDQGPIVVMMENYRSGLLWNLFMSCPEVKMGMRKLGFTGPHL